MNNGFVKVAAATPKIKVGDCGLNGSVKSKSTPGMTDFQQWERGYSGSIVI